VYATIFFQVSLPYSTHAGSETIDSSQRKTLAYFVRHVNDDEEKVKLMGTFSGLYYKHVMLINDASSGVIKWSFKLTDAARGVIYDRHVFIIQATDQEFSLVAKSNTKSTKINF
jgi:hypothetical protein